MSGGGRRGTVLVPLALAALAVALVGPLWDPGRAPAERDLLAYFPVVYRLPWDPAWDPRITGGLPAWTNPQSGVLYPPAWLLAADFHRGWPAFVALHLALLGAATWAWLRREHGPGPAAALGAAAATASGAAWSLAHTLNLLPGFALLPLALLGARWLLDGRRAHGAALVAGVVAGTWASGGVELLVATPAAAGLWVLLAPGAPGGARARALPALGLGAALGLALVAVQLLPFLGVLPHTVRAQGLDPAEVLRWSMDGRELLRVVAHRLVLPEGQPYFDTLYMGVLPAGLALVACSSPRRAAPALLAALPFALLAAGGNTPLLPWLVAQVPGLDVVRYPVKWWLGTVPLAAWLVALGWQRLGRALPRLAGPGPALLAGALLALDLVPAHHAVLEVLPAARVTRPPAVVAAVLASWDRPWTPRLWDDSYNRRAGLPALGLSGVETALEMGHPNVPARFGVGLVFGFAANGLQRPDAYVRAAATRPDAERHRLLRLAGADYWLVWDQAEALAFAGATGLRPTPAAPGTALVLGLLREPDPDPPASWAPGARVVADPAAAVEALAAGGDRAVLVAGDPGVAALPPAAATAPPTRLGCAAPDDDHLTCTWEAPEAGLLRIRTAWAPGWEVALDEGPFQPAARGDHWRLVLPAPAGAHTAHLRYRPEGQGAGAAISVLAALAVLGLVRRGRAQGHQVAAGAGRP